MENQPVQLDNDKKAAVESMLDSIAWRYEFLKSFSLTEYRPDLAEKSN